jgi:hypothetical protein
VLAREDVKCIFMLLKPRLNTSGCVYGRIVVLKNCIIVRKKHQDQRMRLVTYNVRVITSSNSIIQSKYRSSRILDTAAQLITDLSPCFTVGTRHSGLEASLGDVQT